MNNLVPSILVGSINISSTFNQSRHSVAVDLTTRRETSNIRIFHTFIYPHFHINNFYGCVIAI